MFFQKLRNKKKSLHKKTILISECVHYCGFPYGRGAFNPYEQYIYDIAKNSNSQRRRDEFILFLRFYRPRNMDEALGVQSKRPMPLWLFPWNKAFSGDWEGVRAWLDDPDDVPDILTHFSKKGILEWRILEEFVWLERAFYSIRRHGYQPDRYGSFIRLLPLIRQDGECRYIVLDGNHRLCALYALGEASCTAVLEMPIYARDVLCWPCVAGGHCSAEDAITLFYAYFNRSVAWRTTDIPAALLY